MPDEDDYYTTINAIFRIQDVYQYTVDELLNEVYAESQNKPYRPINGKRCYFQNDDYSLNCSNDFQFFLGHDCMDIAKYAFDHWDNYHAIMWFQQAEQLLKPLGKEENKKVFIELYDLLSEALYRVRVALMQSLTSTKLTNFPLTIWSNSKRILFWLRMLSKNCLNWTRNSRVLMRKWSAIPNKKRS